MRRAPDGGGVGGLVRRDSTWTQETGALIFEVLTGSQMLAEARDTKAGLEKRLTRARNAMESMTLPCTRDGGAPVTGGDGEPGGLAPGDGRGPDGDGGTAAGAEAGLQTQGPPVQPAPRARRSTLFACVRSFFHSQDEGLPRPPYASVG